MRWREAAAATAVVGLCGAAVAAGTAAQSAAGPQTSGGAEVDGRELLRSVVRACPAAAGPDDRLLVAAASVPGAPGQDIPGMARIAADGEELTRITRPGATATTDRVPVGRDARVNATGGLAPALVTGQVLADPRGEGQGLASAPCGPAVAEAWLLGGGAQPGQRSVVRLSNPTDSDSVVDLTAYGKGGVIEATGDDGVTVAAGRTVEVRVDALAPRMDVVALRVRTTSGLIAPALVDDRMNGLTPLGAEVMTDAGPPRRNAVLAGMPAGAGSRELHLLPLGDGAVRITALTENGPLPLLAGQPVAVKRGSVTALDLTDELAGRAAALRITGDMPFVAGALATTAVDESVKRQRAAAVAAAERALKQADGDAERAEAQAALAKAETADAIDPGEDFAWFGPAPALTRTGAVTPVRSDLDTTIMATAVGSPATVRVDLLPAGQSGARPAAGRAVTVADGTTAALPVRPPRGTDSYTIVVTRTGGRGQVHVGHVQLEDGRSMTGYPVTGLEVWMPATRVVPLYTD